MRKKSPRKRRLRLENNIDEDENLELDASPVNLNDEIESEDEELPPPEEEKDEARELNVGNILALIFIGVAVIFLIVMAAGSAKSKKKIQSRELDKSGSKTAIEFKERTEKAPDVKDDVQQIFEEEKKGDMPMSEKDADDVLSTLPPELQSGTAPVTSVGSRSSSAKSDRPDTRNSKSPRKIEGIAGQDYVAANANSNIVSAVMNGNFPQTAASSRMTKEEYIAQQMQRTQQIQNSLYGSSGSYGGTSQSQSAAYQSNREEFFNNQGSGTGNGQFLPYNTLWDGTIISGALVTAINTDNPGVVIARVTQNVYSSYDHSLLLIPEGSLLYATYNSSVSYGQNKVQVAWNLLIRPDGYRISLGNMNGVSAQGASGYKGSVSNHPWATMKALGMIAVYSMIQTDMSKSINSQNNEYIQNAMTDVWAQSSKIGNKIIDRALDIKPTIAVPVGREIKLITNVPLELPPCKVNQAERKYVRTR